MAWVTSELQLVSNCHQGEQGTYQMNVLMNPFEALPLVEQPNVEVTICLHLLAGKKAPNTNTVIESDNDKIIFSCVDQTGPVQIRIR